MTSESRASSVTIAAAIDDAWVPHFATCVASIAESRGREAIRILLLQGPTLSSNSVADVRAYVRTHRIDFDAVAIPDYMLASLPPTLLFSPLVWYRLLLPELLPDLDRILCLDADTLVLQSLAPLYELDLGECILAAVGQPVAGAEGRMRTIGLEPSSPYFNAGVMLLNLAAMRAERVGPRALQLGHERLADFVFAEQDALNVVLAGRWQALVPKWNALSYLWLLPGHADGTYSDLDLDVARSSPAIVHFEGFQTVKPWYFRSVHPLRHLYREYRARTPWPLDRLEGKSLSGAVLRSLPVRWQYGLTRAKARVGASLARG